MSITKQRSPIYPATDLAAALEDIRRVYQQETRGPFVSEVAARALGYKSLSGPARKRLSALRQYGLLVQKRGGEARLSERALTLVLGRSASREYQAALREAALEPPLFRELVESSEDSSEESLRHSLIVERGFTPSGASEVLKAFHRTMALAGISAEALLRQHKGNNGGTYEATHPQGRASPASEPLDGPRERVPLRLLGGRFTAVVELPHQMSEPAWRQMVTMLEALKPGYVTEEDSIPTSRD